MSCLFCKIISREIPADIVYEDDKTIAFLDIRPVNPGHTLVVPKKHEETCLKTSDNALSAMITTVKKIGSAVLQSVKADAFNIAVNCGEGAGQVIFHTHFHIIPRFPNDGLELWHGKEMPSKRLKKIATDIRNKTTRL